MGGMGFVCVQMTRWEYSHDKLRQKKNPTAATRRDVSQKNLSQVQIVADGVGGDISRR
jgi:hypothetical protein